MSKKVSIDNLAKEIESTLTEFIGVTDEACAKGVTETAQDAVKELRSAHPPGSGEYGSWDAYNKGWSIFQTKTDRKKHVSATIHNKTHYRLTHLLEKGHAKVNGGRTRAFPHIAPVEQKSEEELVKNIRKNIEG